MSVLLTEVLYKRRKHPIGVWVNPLVHTTSSHDIHRCLVAKVWKKNSKYRRKTVASWEHGLELAIIVVQI